MPHHRLPTAIALTTVTLTTVTLIHLACSGWPTPPPGLDQHLPEPSEPGPLRLQPATTPASASTAEPDLASRSSDVLPAGEVSQGSHAILGEYARW